MEEETEDGFDNFENEMTTTPLRSSPSPPPSSSLFVRYLSDFLFSKSGSKYKANFRFDGNLTCNEPAPPIQVKNHTMQIIFRIDDHRSSEIRGFR